MTIVVPSTVPMKVAEQVIPTVPSRSSIDTFSTDTAGSLQCYIDILCP